MKARRRKRSTSNINYGVMLGLTGRDIYAKLNSSFDAFLYRDFWLPVHVIEERPKWLFVEVLPHKNPNESFGISKPYKMTLDKNDIHNGLIEIDM